MSIVIHVVRLPRNLRWRLPVPPLSHREPPSLPHSQLQWGALRAKSWKNAVRVYEFFMASL